MDGQRDRSRPCRPWPRVFLSVARTSLPGSPVPDGLSQRARRIEEFLSAGFGGEPPGAGSLRAIRYRRGPAKPCRRARWRARVPCRQPRRAEHAATKR